MSLTGNQVFDQATQNGMISKRQQKKLQQVLRQIAASENPDPKSHKKRRNPTQRKSDPQARKLIKTQSQQSDPRNKQGSSSIRQVSQDESRGNQKSTKRQIKDLHNVYNKKYGIPEQSEGFSEYMVNYTYDQKSKYVEKECEDWAVLENLGGKKIQTVQLIKDQELCSLINLKLSEQKEKVRQPFTKDNKDFVRRVLNDLLQ